MPDPTHSDDGELSEKLRQAFGDSADTGLDQSAKHGDTALPDTSELDARLKAVTERTANYKQRKAQTAEELAKVRKAERADAHSLGMGLQIAYTIIGFPLLGFGSGAAIDAFTKSNIWKGILGMAGCVLAIFLAVILIKKANSET